MKLKGRRQSKNVEIAGNPVIDTIKSYKDMIYNKVVNPTLGPDPETAKSMEKFQKKGPTLIQVTPGQWLTSKRKGK